MGIEIERKFLVIKSKWDLIEKGVGRLYRQGYILSDPEKTIRVRLTDTDGFLTIKGMSHGATRQEFEYFIPQEEALELLNNFAANEVSKIRYKIEVSGKIWEVDEFIGANAGLIIAEVELFSEFEPFVKPVWAGKEVTGDIRYYNSNIATNPYSSWEK